MKSKILLLLAVVGITFSSCDLTGEANYTPQIYPYISPADSLGIYRTDVLDVFRMDTITVGDTVSFYIQMTGIENNLTAFYLTQSADSAAKIILPDKGSMDSIFLSTSDYKTGKFLMKGTSTDLFFPFKYIARKPSNEAKLTFTIVSDANFSDSYIGTNTSTLTIKTPIVEKLVSE